MAVKPGMVLISLTRNSPSARRNKSTRAIPSQSSTSNVRTAAFAVLQPYQSSDYKPETDKAGRKASLAAWQTWLDGIVAKESAVKPQGPGR